MVMPPKATKDLYNTKNFGHKTFWVLLLDTFCLKSKPLDIYCFHVVGLTVALIMIQINIYVAHFS